MQQTYKGIKNVRRGFTLVEMLIVLSIIGALTASSLSLYREIVENQKVTATIEILGIYAQAHYAPKKLFPNLLPATTGIFNHSCVPFQQHCPDTSPYRHSYTPLSGGSSSEEPGYLVNIGGLSKSACEKIVTRVFNLYKRIDINWVEVKNISDVPSLCVKTVGEAGKNSAEKSGNRIRLHAVTE